MSPGRILAYKIFGESQCRGVYFPGNEFLKKISVRCISTGGRESRPGVPGSGLWRRVPLSGAAQGTEPATAAPRALGSIGALAAEPGVVVAPVVGRGRAGRTGQGGRSSRGGAAAAQFHQQQLLRLAAGQGAAYRHRNSTDDSSLGELLLCPDFR
jgi:hypothetical protein